MRVAIRDDVVVPNPPEALYAWTVAIEAARHVGADSLVMSGGREGAHSRKSKHWSGLAFDCYVTDWTLKRAQFRDALRESLPLDYDVVLEDSHVHVEFDPEWSAVLVRKVKARAT